MKNIKLKVLRTIKNLSIDETAALLEVTPSQYKNIENGRSLGSVTLWKRFQNEFKIPDEEMWKYIVKGDKYEE